MKKILIIEDDPIMTHVCQRVLTKQGYATELASDGAQGLERLNAVQPDAVLLDLMMPHTNGVAVLTSLRAQEQFRHLPVIVLTNACVPTLIEQASKAGATHILDKSKFSPVAITELLRGLLDVNSTSPLPIISQTEPIKHLA